MDKETYFYNYETINYHNIDKIAGFDEAGRGAIAGPIVVAAVILPVNFKHPLIKDSKQLSQKERELAYQIIIDNALDYAITIVSLKTIEERNPKVASIIGMETAFKSLTLEPNVCLVDFEKPNFLAFTGTSESIVKGDQKSINIAAASILAKVTRDRIMVQYNSKYPDYQFDKHKGYYTKTHQCALETYGILENIHRKTYLPIKKLMEK